MVKNVGKVKKLLLLYFIDILSLITIQRLISNAELRHILHRHTREGKNIELQRNKMVS
jgi:hypothetical protein